MNQASGAAFHHRSGRSWTSIISASALLVVALTSAGAAGAPGAAQQTAACQIAINELTAHLPELSATASGYEWRSLPTVFQCDAEGSVESASLRWRDGRGLLSDARSAIAAFGSRITGDTATSIRGAFDRCLSTGGRSLGETAESTTGRTAVTCTITRTEAVVAVGRRKDR